MLQSDDELFVKGMEAKSMVSVTVSSGKLVHLNSETGE